MNGMQTQFTLISGSVAQTEQIGTRLGSLLQASDVLCLSGELGAGKTALARGVVAGWGALEPATSPTFVLIHEHQRARDAMRLQHIDAYRLERLEDAALLGLEDIFANGSAVIIEWAERVQQLLPADHMWIDLDFVADDEQARQLTFAAHGARSVDLLAAFRAQEG